MLVGINYNLITLNVGFPALDNQPDFIAVFAPSKNTVMSSDKQG